MKKSVRRRSHRKRKGFTLIELVLVIAILGILASLAIPKFTDYRDKVKINKFAMDLKTIEKTVDLLVLEENKDFLELAETAGTQAKKDITDFLGEILGKQRGHKPNPEGGIYESHPNFTDMILPSPMSWYFQLSTDSRLFSIRIEGVTEKHHQKLLGEALGYGDIGATVIIRLYEY